MDEGVLVVLAGALLLSPLALTVAVVVQGRRRQALEAEVRRLSLQVDALGKRVAAGAAAAPSRVATPTPEPVLQTSLPPPLPEVEPARPAPPPALAPDVAAVPLPPPLTAPPPPPAWSPPPEPPAPVLPRIDWESLVGVRLFSWVAGVALLVAAVSFLRWSIENGWLGPAVRAALGALAGVALLVVAETERARRYRITAQSMAAAGVGTLFATVFAAHSLWDLLPAWAAFPLLVLVAAVAIAYAVRRESLTMALLGLAGGFATPILLSTGEDRPLGLFSYLLLLNAGLTWVAHKRRWPVLGAVSLGFTALYQLGWVVRFLGEGNLLVGLVVFLVFPAFGFLALALARRGDRAVEAVTPVARWTATLGALPAVLFLLKAVADPDLAHRWPMVLAFAVLLCAGLLVVAALQGPEWLHLLGAGAATLAILATLDGGQAAEAWPALLLPVLALAAVLLAGPLLLERRGRPLRAEGRLGVFAAPLLMGGLVLVVRSLPAESSPALPLVATLALAAAIAAVAVRSGEGRLLLAAGAMAPWPLLGWAPRPGASLPVLVAAVLLGAVAIAALRSTERRLGRPDPGPWWTAGVASLLVAGQLAGAAVSAGLTAWSPAPGATDPGLPLVAALAVALLLLLAGLLAAGARTGRHVLALVAVATTFLASASFAMEASGGRALALVVPLWLLQVAAPYGLLRRQDRSRLPLWAAAAATGLSLVLVRQALHQLELPLLVGPAALLMALALVPHLLLLLRAPGGLAAERSRLVVVAGAILALVTAAIPLQLEDEWITIGWALLVPALAWLHGRLRHRGLLAWMAGLAIAVVVRLALNEAVLHYHPRSGTPVWNFWLYAYGLPALALLVAARLLPKDDDRVHPELPRLAPLLAAGGGLLLFLLLNVEIADAFSTGTWVRLRLRGSLAYDLALTIGWATFALGLLVVGVILRSKATRITSIALLAVTVVKGFLLDLGRLEGLYRTASFVGLAVSLLLVAVVLQRYVLADREARPGA